ncbi:lipid-A-disaccharide synthase-related protein [Synechocystis sp. LKSZ1]|uniref:lipid-A-disaccharide synthase-related protein n=1 Tax=Synechocystis sp. LKSZ1 TaxID=3144951 RepID=UPI00336C108C
MRNVLFLSNGHGEDLNAGLIISALQQLEPQIVIQGLPLVGEGQAYRNQQIPLIAPTRSLPSGGIIYTSPLNWIKDISSGLLGLLLQQLQALLRVRHRLDLLVAVGDIVPIAFAYFSGRPFIVFLVSTSSYYEGRLRIPVLTLWCLRSSRCVQILTRDSFTAQDLQARGLHQAQCLGYPVMDALTPKGIVLPQEPGRPLIALLPGSRLPEAINNLELLLPLCERLTDVRPSHFAIALVSVITPADLQALADRLGWIFENQQLCKGLCRVSCHWQAFADIVHRCDLVLGMAGTAVEQAVGLGKPVLQIPGHGPQFTYAFAEAQMRLLGLSVTMVGKHPQEVGLVDKAVAKILTILDNPAYLARCRENGVERLGPSGGSLAIAHQIQATLQDLAKTTI